MANKKLGEFSTLDEDFVCAPIAQPAVAAQKFDIKSRIVSCYHGSVKPVRRLYFWECSTHLQTFTICFHGEKTARYSESVTVIHFFCST